MQLEALVREVYGFERLRPLQARAIEALVGGRDVQLVLPTGGGKSLCFQAPAIAAHREGRGPTLVVSPLIALMEDQVQALQKRGVPAVALHSGMPWAEQRRLLDRLGEHALVYASPERLSGSSSSSKRFLERVQRARPAYLAIDEAHCISEWGHDFRPEYRMLGTLRETLGVPTIAATATATPAVLDDIGKSLAMETPLRIVGDFERPNLRFEVRVSRGNKARVEAAVELLRDRGFATKHRRGAARSAAGRAIVYTITRNRARDTCKALREAGIAATYYHAGRRESARINAQKSFDAGTTPVLVATSAFGMGVDRPDVRVVIHVEAPGTIEAWYQQAGRAGRDGAAADCVLLFGAADGVTHRRLWGQSPSPGTVEGWRALETVAMSTSCRQRAVVEWFSQSPAPDCGRCDACESPDAARAQVDAERTTASRIRSERTQKAKREDAARCSPEQEAAILRFVDGLKKPLGRRLVAAGVRGSRSKAARRKGLPNNPEYGVLRGVPETAVLRALDAMLGDGRLVKKGKKYPTVWMPQKRVRPVRDPSRPRRPQATGLAAVLRAFRKREARKSRLKSYQVFPDKTLKQIVAQRPTTPNQLSEIWGMGPQRTKRYGEAVLEMVIAERDRAEKNSE